MESSEEEAEDCLEEQKIEDLDKIENAEIKNEDRRVSFSSHSEQKKKPKKAKRRHSINICQDKREKRLIVDLNTKIQTMTEEDEHWNRNIPTPTVEERAEMIAIERKLLLETLHSLNITQS